MDRCDFSSIMTCLKNHISESNQMSQPEFLYEVFEDFMDSPESKDFSFDNGLVCRWMTGQAKISPKICTYYARPSKQEKLAETLTEAQKETFGKFKDNKSELTSMTEVTAFTIGFKLGLRLTAEAYTDSGDQNLSE